MDCRCRKGSGVATLLKCNCGGQYQQHYLPGRHEYSSLAGIFITFIRRKNRKKRSYSAVSKNYLSVEINLSHPWVGDDVNLYTLVK